MGKLFFKISFLAKINHLMLIVFHVSYTMNNAGSGPLYLTDNQIINLNTFPMKIDKIIKKKIFFWQIGK